jgi:oligopeptide transport system permease protein
MDPTARDKPHDLERYARLLDEARAIHGTSLAADAWRQLKKNGIAMVSLWFLAILSLLAVLTPLLPLQSPIATDTRQAYAPPTFWPVMIDSLRVSESGDAAVTEGKGDWIENQFGDLDRVNRWLVEIRAKLFGPWSVNSLCGRDDLGRDLLARLFWGARISLIVGLVAALVSLVIGVTYGAISGYCGGRIDNFMMRFVEVLYSVPFVFVVIYIITILSEESIKAELEKYGIDRIKVLFVVVGAIYWLTMARVVRGQVLSLKHEQFVEAARTIGARPSRVLFVHIVPNLLSVIIVYLTLTIPRVMLYEAFLSFLGLGVQAPNVSWGLLANEGFHVITPVKIFWWLFVFPSLAMGMTLFALNFLGDGLRDALDPRLKHK